MKVTRKLNFGTTTSSIHRALPIWPGVCDVSSTAQVVLEMDWKIGLHCNYSPTWVLVAGVSWRCVERFPSLVGQRFLDYSPGLFVFLCFLSSGFGVAVFKECLAVWCFF